MWQRATATNLGVLPGGTASVAISINERAQILGWSLNAQYQRVPVLWQGRAPRDLTARGIPVDSEVVALNDRGDIAATLLRGDVYGRAVLFQQR